METYKEKASGCWYCATYLFNLSNHDVNCKSNIGSRLRKLAYNASGTSSTEAVLVNDESVRHYMGDQALKEECCVDKVNAKGVDCTGNHKDQKKDLIYDMHDLLRTSRYQNRNSMSEQFTRTLRDKDFELSRFRERVRLLKSVSR